MFGFYHNKKDIAFFEELCAEYAGILDVSEALHKSGEHVLSNNFRKKIDRSAAFPYSNKYLKDTQVFKDK